jgi:hypothetical protein
MEEWLMEKSVFSSWAYMSMLVMRLEGRTPFTCRGIFPGTWRKWCWHNGLSVWKGVVECWVTCLFCLYTLSDGNLQRVLLTEIGWWFFTSEVLRKIQTFLSRCLRYILRIGWPRTISDKDLRIATGQ